MESVLPITPFPKIRKFFKILLTSYAILVIMSVFIGWSLCSDQGAAGGNDVICKPETLRAFYNMFIVLLWGMVFAWAPGFLFLFALIQSGKMWIQDLADFYDDGLFWNYGYEFILCVLIAITVPYIFT